MNPNAPNAMIARHLKFSRKNGLDSLFKEVRVFKGLVAHPCGDPNRATQCRAKSVASNSRRIRDVAPKSRYTPANQGVAPFSGPPCRTFLSFAAGRGCGGLVEGIAALLGSENRSRYRGVSQLQSHQSRYSVQLSSRAW